MGSFSDLIEKPVHKKKKKEFKGICPECGTHWESYFSKKIYCGVVCSSKASSRKQNKKNKRRKKSEAARKMKENAT